MKHDWEQKYIVNIENNTSVDLQELKYNFHADGKMQIQTQDSIIYLSTWELLEDEKYLRLGSETCFIEFFNSKILTLRYGKLKRYLFAK